MNGTEPLFFSKNISWKPFLPPPSPHQTSQLTTIPTYDSKLAHIYTDLQTFSITTNLAFQSTNKISPTLFQEILISTQYRLSFLEYPYNFIEHILRLALLVFSTTIFLQTRGIRTRFQPLSAQLRTAVVGDRFRELEWQLRVWILVMAAIVAVTEEDDFWILPLLRKEIKDHVELRHWEDLRRVLKRFLWIDVLHDPDGKMVCEKIFAGSESADAALCVKL